MGCGDLMHCGDPRHGVAKANELARTQCGRPMTNLLLRFVELAIASAGGRERRKVSAINTLAAPSRAGCSAGYGKLFELFAVISDPKDPAAWSARETYVKKEYAAEAAWDERASRCVAFTISS